MEIGNIKPETMQIIKEQMGAATARGENPQAVEAASALPVNIQETQSTVEALKELLVSYGLNVGKENIELMQKLLENGMPSDKESVLRLNQALKLFNMLDMGTNPSGKELNLEKAVFALKNQLPLTGETVYKMDGFLSESKSISTNIDIIMQELGNLEKSPASDEILRIFTGEEIPLPQVPQAEAEAAPMETPQSISPKAEQILQPQTIPVTDNISEPIVEFAENNTANAEVSQKGTEQTVGDLSDRQKPILSAIIKEYLINTEKPDVEVFFAKLETISEKNAPITKEQAIKFAADTFGDNPEIVHLLSDALEKDNKQGEFSPTKLEGAFRKFRLDPKENDMEKLEQTLTELKLKTAEAIKHAENMDAKLPDSLNKALKDLNNNLEFINQLKTCIYIPIPLNTPTGAAEGELYVFKDGRSKSKNGARSALIGLNTVNLGRVEAYIQKQENRLNLQFRLENMDTNKLINSHAQALINLLEGAGLKLSGISAIPLDTAFDILKKEPSRKENNYELGDKAFDTRA